MDAQRGVMEPAVLFRLGTDWYGIAVAHVREVVRVPVITAVPFTPAHVRGMVAVRGEFVPVIDVPTVLHRSLPLSSPPQAPTRLVVVTAHDLAAALLVDEVTDVVQVAREGTATTASWHDRTVHMLDIPALLDTTRLERAATMEECV